MPTIDELTSVFPRTGRLDWIGIRPERRSPLISVPMAHLLAGGLEGDHRNKAGARAVTLIQGEHLPAIAALAGLSEIDPAMLRRNLVVSGINLLALRHRKFRIGGTVVKGIETCPPCSRMEEALGTGGYNAMRGHGGLCAAVIEPGTISLGDSISAICD